MLETKRITRAPAKESQEPAPDSSRAARIRKQKSRRWTKNGEGVAKTWGKWIGREKGMKSGRREKNRSEKRG